MNYSDIIYFDATGFHYPDYPTLLEKITTDFKNIYGVDVYIDPDSQDGQNLAIRAAATYDVCQIIATSFTQFSPSFAQGLWLSSTVKINGIRRLEATNSTVDLTIIGTAGTVITSGQAEDTNGNKWNLPTVTIPSSGTITVTATAATAGAIEASSNTITKISTPTLGWQSVNNLLPATAGRNMETDAELRARQRISTAMPSLSTVESVIGGVANIVGVTRYKVYENDTSVADVDGIPAHSISAVVEGGDSLEIANVIRLRKSVGVTTFGTTNILTYDSYGIPLTVNFYRPSNATINIEVSITPLSGYLTAYADEIKAALIAYIAGLDIGEDVLITKLYKPALTVHSDTYDISLIRISKNAGALGTINVPVLFNEVATTSTSTITVITL